MDNLKVILLALVVILALSTFYFWNKANKAESIVLEYKKMADSETDRAEALSNLAARNAAEARIAVAETEKQKKLAEEAAIEAQRQAEIARQALMDCKAGK